MEMRMKKASLLLILGLLTACSNDETIKEVEVIKEVQVPVETIKEINALEKVEPYIKTIEKAGSGISHEGAAVFLKGQIKKCFDTPTGKDYDFFNIYIGDHRHDRNDIPNMAGYGNNGHIIVVFFKKNITQEIRIYEPYSNYYVFKDILDYGKFIETNFIFSDDFFKNKFVGSMSKEDFLKI